MVHKNARLHAMNLPSTDVMTLDQVAKYLKIHPMTAYRLAQEHQLPMFKVGGSWRTTARRLQTWLASKR